MDKGRLYTVGEFGVRSEVGLRVEIDVLCQLEEFRWAKARLDQWNS